MATLPQAILPPDVLASRPAAGSPGRLFYATDTQVLYRDDGTAWDAMAMGGGTPADHDHTGAGAGGVLTNDKHDGYGEYAQLGGDPSAPSGGSNLIRLYAKDKAGTATLYYITEGGTIYELPTISGGGGSGAPADAHYITTQAEAGLSAETLLSSVIASGLLGSRPAFGLAGRLYYATDAAVLYRDSGAAWAAVGFASPMTADQDLIVGGGSGAATRLAKGSAGQVLTVHASTGLLTWTTPTTGMADPLTTKGDLVVRAAVTTRLGVGSDGDVLTADSGAADGVSWQTPSGSGGGGPASDTAHFITTQSELSLANETVLGAGVIMSGALSSRPAAGVAGRVYLDTESQVLHRDDGGTWSVYVGPGGWQPYAMPAGITVNAGSTATVPLTSNGGTGCVPVALGGPLLLQSVSFYTLDTSGTRGPAEFAIYQESRQVAGVLDLVAGAVGTLAQWTASAVATRTVAVTSPPIVLLPGVYWVAVKNNHGSATLGIGWIQTAASNLQANLSQTKTLTTSAFGSTLDMVAATWTKQAHVLNVRLNGRVFGQSSAF